jgi:hypothetical protein
MVPRGAIAGDRTCLFALAERWIRPADQLDYVEANRLIAIDPFFRWSHKRSRGVSRSTPLAALSRRGNGLLSEVRAVIGQYLRAKREITQPIPPARCQTI